MCAATPSVTVGGHEHSPSLPAPRTDRPEGSSRRRIARRASGRDGRVLVMSAGVAAVGEVHLSHRSNWLRAGVLGANDGILSTSSLILGVAGSGAGRTAVITAGVAGLVAGALSMAACEYVSVSSQRDTENADVLVEARELDEHPDAELHELAVIYERRGLAQALAQQVAEALTAQDALSAHLRDELGLEDARRARPLQAAGSSRWPSPPERSCRFSLPRSPAARCGPWSRSS